MRDQNPGLRERKRLETRMQLERAAVLLAGEVGLENATVDAICATIPVSSRTFFNYFESKEDAILGARDIPLDDQLIAQVNADYADQRLTGRVVALLLVAMGPTIGDTELHEARIRIIRQHPELLSRQIGQLTRTGERLVAAVADLLALDPAFAGTPDDERSVIAELILPLCGGAVRLALKEWISAGGQRPVPELHRRAVELAGKVIETLA